jgi:hypothetical protein
MQPQIQIDLNSEIQGRIEDFYQLNNKMPEYIVLHPIAELIIEKAEIKLPIYTSTELDLQEVLVC